ncbi:hypothetical protein SNEBB_007376 [Seison nebaliae]|nr:hypothetical protein SNEBB_007376 [Seison nebaliae]
MDILHFKSQLQNLDKDYRYMALNDYLNAIEINSVNFNHVNEYELYDCIFPHLIEKNAEIQHITGKLIIALTLRTKSIRNILDRILMIIRKDSNDSTLLLLKNIIKLSKLSNGINDDDNSSIILINLEDSRHLWKSILILFMNEDRSDRVELLEIFGLFLQKFGKFITDKDRQAIFSFFMESIENDDSSLCQKRLTKLYSIFLSNLPENSCDYYVNELFIMTCVENESSRKLSLKRLINILLTSLRYCGESMSTTLPKLTDLIDELNDHSLISEKLMLIELMGCYCRNCDNKYRVKFIYESLKYLNDNLTIKEIGIIEKKQSINDDDGERYLINLQTTKDQQMDGDKQIDGNMDDDDENDDDEDDEDDENYDLYCALSDDDISDVNTRLIAQKALEKNLIGILLSKNNKITDMKFYERIIENLIVAINNEDDYDVLKQSLRTSTILLTLLKNLNLDNLIIRLEWSFQKHLKRKKNKNYKKVMIPFIESYLIHVQYFIAIFPQLTDELFTKYFLQMIYINFVYSNELFPLSSTVYSFFIMRNNRFTSTTELFRSILFNIDQKQNHFLHGLNKFMLPYLQCQHNITSSVLLEIIQYYLYRLQSITQQLSVDETSRTFIVLSLSLKKFFDKTEKNDSSMILQQLQSSFQQFLTTDDTVIHSMNSINYILSFPDCECLWINKEIIDIIYRLSIQSFKQSYRSLRRKYLMFFSNFPTKIEINEPPKEFLSYFFKLIQCGDVALSEMCFKIILNHPNWLKLLDDDMREEHLKNLTKFLLESTKHDSTINYLKNYGRLLGKNFTKSFFNNFVIILLPIIDLKKDISKNMEIYSKNQSDYWMSNNQTNFYNFATFLGIYLASGENVLIEDYMKINFFKIFQKNLDEINKILQRKHSTPSPWLQMIEVIFTLMISEYLANVKGKLSTYDEELMQLIEVISLRKMNESPEQKFNSFHLYSSLFHHQNSSQLKSIFQKIIKNENNLKILYLSSIKIFLNKLVKSSEEILKNENLMENIKTISTQLISLLINLKNDELLEDQTLRNLLSECFTFSCMLNKRNVNVYSLLELFREIHSNPFKLTILIYSLKLIFSQHDIQMDFSPSDFLPVFNELLSAPIDVNNLLFKETIFETLSIVDFSHIPMDEEKIANFENHIIQHIIYKEEFVRRIEMGSAFTIVIDNGLNLRKSAYNFYLNLLNSFSEMMIFNKFHNEIFKKALADVGDVQFILHSIFLRLIVLWPTKIYEHQKMLCERMSKAIDGNKDTSNAVHGRNKELKMSLSFLEQEMKKIDIKQLEMDKELNTIIPPVKSRGNKFIDGYQQEFYMWTKEMILKIPSSSFEFIQFDPFNNSINLFDF